MADHLKSLLLTFFMLAAGFGGASAQAGLTVRGTVYDQNGAVINGATVRALNISSGRERETRTDSEGRYELPGLQPGLYRVAALSEGFATSARSITLREPGPFTQNFSLVPGQIEDAITVTAGKGSARVAADTPQPVVIVDSLDVEKRRPLSTLQAIEATPNLSQVGVNPALERPRLRGLTSNRLLLVVDGERLNNVRSDPLSGVSPSIIDVTGLQSVEVVSGGGSSLYGSDALAGTINLITRQPVQVYEGRYLGLRFDGDLHTNGTFRRGATTLNLSTSRIALRLSGSLFRQDDYTAGDGAIPLEEVVRLGRFANDLGNAAGNNVARTYSVWDLPRGAEIPNGQARGFNDQIDVWFFPSPAHSLRYRQLNSQHKDIGFPFIALPFEPREQSNGFRRLDRTGARYEGREISPWLQRLAGGFYRQKYSFPDNNIVSTIDAGSSWEISGGGGPGEGAVPILTGNPSTFSPGSFTEGKSSVTSYGLDFQATLARRTGAALTTGLVYLRDSSRDEFSRFDLSSPTPVALGGRASNPDSIYENVGWFNLVEYEPARWLRLSGGFRLDNWKSEAKVTSGFPLGAESAILSASLEGLAASPGSIDLEGLEGIDELVSGQSGISTNNTIATGNFGAVFRLRGGINPYFRVGNSYREPGITERYILRNFGDPTFSVLLVSNTALKPERGLNYDAGVKVRRDNWSASVGYFRNNLKDFLRPAFSDAIFVPADPARGLEPISPFFPFHGVLYVQRTNTARARIQGVEAAYDFNISLGSRGDIMPFGSLGWLKGSDLTPDPNALRLIDQFYNSDETPVRLEGSADDVPLIGITPFRGVFGVRYGSREGAWFGEYQVRYQARVRRADPLDLSATISTQYGTLASLDSFAKRSLRVGYTLRKEDRRTVFTFGVENLTDRLYFEHFQTAPAPGRSFVFGVTFDISKVRF